MDFTWKTWHEKSRWKDGLKKKIRKWRVGDEQVDRYGLEFPGLILSVLNVWTLLPDMLNVKQSLCRPERTLGSPEERGCQISRQSAHEGGKVFGPKHRLPLSPRKYSWDSYLADTESIPGPWWGRKNYEYEKFQCHLRESNTRPSSF